MLDTVGTSRYIAHICLRTHSQEGRLAPKVGLKPLHVQLDPDLHRALRIKAAQEDRSLRAVVEEAIRRHCETPAPKTKRGAA